MKTPMTLITERHTIVDVKSNVWMSSPRINVVSRKFAAFFLAFLASAFISIKHIFPPFYAFRPKSAALIGVRHFAFVVPVEFAAINRCESISAFIGACSFFSVWLVKNTRPADLAKKVNSSLSVIVRSFANVRLAALFNCFGAPSNSNIPNRRFSFSQMTRSKSLYPKFLHFISHSSSAAFIFLSDFIRGNSLICIHFKKDVFRNIARLHNDDFTSNKLEKQGNYCTATNTWKRTAISTW